MSREHWLQFTEFFIIVWLVFLAFVFKRFKELDEWPRE